MEGADASKSAGAAARRSAFATSQASSAAHSATRPSSCKPALDLVGVAKTPALAAFAVQGVGDRTIRFARRRTDARRTGRRSGVALPRTDARDLSAHLRCNPALLPQRRKTGCDASRVRGGAQPLGGGRDAACDHRQPQLRQPRRSASDATGERQRGRTGGSLPRFWSAGRLRQCLLLQRDRRTLNSAHARRGRCRHHRGECHSVSVNVGVAGNLASVRARTA